MVAGSLADGLCEGAKLGCIKARNHPIERHGWAVIGGEFYEFPLL